MIKKIRKFNEINIIPNSLVVFDIDDTLIRFDELGFNWWNNKINEYYEKTNNYETADMMTYKDWLDIVSKNDPKLVDDEVHHFIDKLKKNKCHIILLTAREILMKEMTHEHLSKHDLYFEHIYFNKNKGDELKKIILKHYFDINNVIVIDDIAKNLLDIELNVKLPNVKLHLFNIIT